MNCLIALEANEPAAAGLHSVVAAGHDGRVAIAIPAVAASERKKGGGYLQHFEEFRDRINALRLADAKLLEPIAYYGIAFYGHGYWANEEMVELERAIHQTLHPNIEYGIAEFCNANRLPLNTAQLPGKWRNAKCDVQAIWSHIHHGADVFVTSDKNFLRPTKAARLIELGAKAVMTPDQAAASVAICDVA